MKKVSGPPIRIQWKGVSLFLFTLCEYVFVKGYLVIGLVFIRLFQLAREEYQHE